MEKTYFFSRVAVAVGVAALTACSHSDNIGSSAGIIHVADAIENPVELKVSDIGSKITYAPLETTDSSLVPELWALVPTDNHIIVVCYSSSGMEDKNALAFDLSGRFISGVGHVGEDPEAYSSPFPVVASADNLFFQKGWGKNVSQVEYSITGNYLGRFFPKMPVSPQSSRFVDSTLVTVVPNFYLGELYPTIFSGKITGEADTTVIRTAPEDAFIRQPYIEASMNTYQGVMANSAVTFREVDEQAGEKRHDYSLDRVCNTLAKTDGRLHFYMPLTDTVYTVTENSIEPLYVMDCGKDALKPSHFNHQEFPADVVFVTEICETPSQLIFGASRGWLGLEDHQPYVGYYDKTTGNTYATQAKKGFVDDLTGFMPFYPVLSNNRGDLFGIITMEELAAWREEHPDAELPEALQSLDEDSNPICVIVSR